MWTSSFQVGSVKDFQWLDLEKAWVTQNMSSLFTDMVWLITQAQPISPMLSYVIENTPFQLDQREKVQKHYMLVKHYLEESLLPCNTLNFTISSDIHHQRPKPASFSHIGWPNLLPTNYKVRETSLVSCEHNRKTKRCLVHLFFFPRSTHLSWKWTRLGVSSCFNHLGWTKPRRKRKGYGVPN
jgi:hypothetical protein